MPETETPRYAARHRGTSFPEHNRNSTNPLDWIEALHKVYPDINVHPLALVAFFEQALRAGYVAGLAHEELDFGDPETDPPLE